MADRIVLVVYDAGDHVEQRIIDGVRSAIRVAEALGRSHAARRYVALSAYRDSRVDYDTDGLTEDERDDISAAFDRGVRSAREAAAHG